MGTFPLLNELAGSGRWHTLTQCLSGDHVMIPIVVGVNTSVAFMYVWIAHYWKRCSLATSNCHAKSVMRTLRWVFLLCAVCNPVFTLVRMVWPAWWLWVVVSVGFVIVCLRFVWIARRGLVMVYSDLESLRRIKENAKFVETSRQEMDHIREQLCEVKQMVVRER